GYRLAALTWHRMDPGTDGGNATLGSEAGICGDLSVCGIGNDLRSFRADFTREHVHDPVAGVHSRGSTSASAREMTMTVAACSHKHNAQLEALRAIASLEFIK